MACTLSSGANWKSKVEQPQEQYRARAVNYRPTTAISCAYLSCRVKALNVTQNCVRMRRMSPHAPYLWSHGNSHYVALNA